MAHSQQLMGGEGESCGWAEGDDGIVLCASPDEFFTCSVLLKTRRTLCVPYESFSNADGTSRGVAGRATQRSDNCVVLHLANVYTSGDVAHAIRH